MSKPIEDMDIDEIQKHIPHRPPMLMVDRVESIVANESAVGVKMVSISEPFFAGHFPGYPIMPGVYIIEAMAQTAACMVSASVGRKPDGNLIVFTSIDKVKFRQPVRPGAVLKLHVSKVSARGPLWKFNAYATVDDVKTTDASFGAMLVDPK